MRTLPFIAGLALALALVLPHSLLAAESRVEAPTDGSAAARGLLQRWLPKVAQQFVVETIDRDNGQDVFELESRAGKVVLRGNNGVAIASALNQYLKDYCHCDMSWHCGNQLALGQCGDYL